MRTTIFASSRMSLRSFGHHRTRVVLLVRSYPSSLASHPLSISTVPFFTSSFSNLSGLSRISTSLFRWRSFFPQSGKRLPEGLPISSQIATTLEYYSAKQPSHRFRIKRGVKQLRRARTTKFPDQNKDNDEDDEEEDEEDEEDLIARLRHAQEPELVLFKFKKTPAEVITPKVMFVCGAFTTFAVHTQLSLMDIALSTVFISTSIIGAWSLISTLFLANLTRRLILRVAYFPNSKEVIVTRPGWIRGAENLIFDLSTLAKCQNLPVSMTNNGEAPSASSSTSSSNSMSDSNNQSSSTPTSLLSSSPSSSPSLPSTSSTSSIASHENEISHGSGSAPNPGTIVPENSIAKPSVESKHITHWINLSYTKEDQEVWNSVIKEEDSNDPEWNLGPESVFRYRLKFSFSTDEVEMDLQTLNSVIQGKDPFAPIIS
jgi:hypothetical protein